MREGLEFEPWSQPELGPLILGTLALLGSWLLLAAFPRESKRLKWAWTKPRNLTTRNASETPQTLGVALSHTLAYLGILSGLEAIQVAGVSISSWTMPAGWLFISVLLRWLGARLAFGRGDLSSTLAEMARHNHTWVGIVLAVWAVMASLNPTIHSSSAVSWGTLMVFGLATLHGSLRSSQLIQVPNQQKVVGILYLCTLEWGWSLFWILWSIRAALRGH